MQRITVFAEALREHLKSLPGHAAQEKMAPEHRLPHEQWQRYFANARLSGVLILFYPLRESIHTVLIQRPSYEGIHSGQVGFPGGQKEESDQNLIVTALREAREEVGVPLQSVTVLGQLTELYVPPSNFLITPVVAYAKERPRFILDKKEVVEIIEPEVNELLNDKAIGVKSIKVRSDISIQAPYYDIQGRTVWGATAMMISELNELLRKI
jgi:8-oxo-dGTP pyrophosphatase MutT (NUDIX family)